MPSLFVCRKSALEEGGGVCFSVTMRDFLGMERADAETRAALLDFNYNLAVGNSDAAFAAVKTIKNPDVWENMAHMCIKNKRLDVAETCLGNMGPVRGARAVRDAAEEPELDARVAAVAVHLGLTDEAERLYRGCDRHDLLNRLYQASGRWKDAVALASKRDRIHLKTTHYNHAKHLESVGDLQGAIRAYERAGCASAEVPRLLHSRGLTEELERYVASAADAKLTKWWARFCESVGDLERALDAYQAAGDHLSLVRVYCSRGAFDDAARLVEESGDPAAAFHLARTYEARDDVREVCIFGLAVGGHAARLARDGDGRRTDTWRSDRLRTRWRRPRGISSIAVNQRRLCFCFIKPEMYAARWTCASIDDCSNRSRPSWTPSPPARMRTRILNFWRGARPGFSRTGASTRRRRSSSRVDDTTRRCGWRWNTT